MGIHKSLVVVVLVLSVSACFGAGNVDLSTVPRRDSVSLTIYNSEDLTLVREARTLVFKKGVNPLQFSWAGTKIDPTSVQITFLTQVEKLEVLDTTFPHARPQVLYWNVQSEFDGAATVEITYFTSGISWSADYVCVADKDEKTMRVESFVRVDNGSGEEYEDAQVRLVVGRINLVEKIAELANTTPEKLQSMDETRVTALRKLAVQNEMIWHDSGGAKPRGAVGGGGGGGGLFGGGGQPKEVAKESVSDYFIYTIEGTETIPNESGKRLRSFEAMNVPLKIQYRYRPEEYGEELVRMYLMTNDKASKLGTTPLPNGTVNVFRDNGRGGLSYLGDDEIKYVPIGDKIELNLGEDPNVGFELVKLRGFRDQIWMTIEGTEVYRRVDEPGIKINVDATVAGWDEHSIMSQRVGNFTSKAIEVEVRRGFEGDVVFRSELGAILHDFHTVQFTATIPPGKKQDLLFEQVARNGHNAKQEHVTLEKAAVKP